MQKECAAYVGSFPVPWQHHGDYWTDVLFHHLNTNRNSMMMCDAAHLLPDEEPDEWGWVHGFRYQPRRDDEALPDMVLAVFRDGVAVFLESDEPLTPEIVVEWHIAIDAANDALSADPAEFEWSALISPRPVVENRPVTRYLDEPFNIGPYRIEASNKILTEYTSHWSYDLNKPHKYNAEPLVVVGGTTGLHWNEAMNAAKADLRTVCALLSLSDPACFVARTQPWTGDRSVRADPWLRNCDPLSTEERTAWREGSVRRPRWMDRAWHLATTDDTFRAALHMHYEGQLLETGHPSYASVAFVSCIETLGEKLLKLRHCKECNMKKGATERFRLTAALVCDTDEAMTLKRQIYGTRSTTVHASQLHGSELLIGQMHTVGVLARNVPEAFRWGTVERLKSVSRDLLSRFLTEEVWPPTPSYMSFDEILERLHYWSWPTSGEPPSPPEAGTKDHESMERTRESRQFRKERVAAEIRSEGD